MFKQGYYRADICSFLKHLQFRVVIFFRVNFFSHLSLFTSFDNMFISIVIIKIKSIRVPESQHGRYNLEGPVCTLQSNHSFFRRCRLQEVIFMF